MTVMRSSCDVADKAVSTEDAFEVLHLDAVLAALVENKVEAMKAASSVFSVPSKSKWSSAPISPGNSRLTSLSTVSSSQNHHHCHHHHQQHHRDKHQNKKGHHHSSKNDQHHHKHHHQQHKHRHRRYDSAPCEKYIEDLTNHQQKQRRAQRRSSETIQSSKYKRQYSKSSNILPDDVYLGLDSPIDVIGLNHNLAFINIERHPHEASSDNGEYPGLNQSAYMSHSAAHLNIDNDDEDYIALDITDELDIDSLNYPELSILDSPEEHYRRPRKKRKRKRRPMTEEIIMRDVPEVMLVDHDELPPRARWTIVVTACILFAMSILLVGVTLRMAPIIDEMVRKENEELLNSLNRDTSVPENNTGMPL